MEDSFKVRVDKVFGSLPSSSASSTKPALSSSLWCLADEEIEPDRWNRDKDESEPEPEPELEPEPEPEPSPFNQWKTEDDLNDLEEDLGYGDDLEEEEKSLDKPKPDDYNDEEWDIKNSIGRDCTLDYEEAEDVFDKVGVGKANNDGDRIYMGRVNDYGIDIDTCYELPSSIEGVERDPRANIMAARIRLEEDAEAAKKMVTLRVTDKESPVSLNPQVNPVEDANVKSILKRKDDQVVTELDSKQQKRVRFDPECKDGRDDESGDKDSNTETNPMGGIPDYMRNPSKYTRYTFDPTDEVDDTLNRQAYMDFLKMLKSSNNADAQPDDVPADLSKSVAFVPRKKTSDVTVANNCTEPKKSRDSTGEESMFKRGLPFIMAVDDTDGLEVCAMEEDEPETGSNSRGSSQRHGRRYRNRAMLETEDAL